MSATKAEYQAWPAWLHTNGYEGYRRVAVMVVRETMVSYEITPIDKPIKLAGRARWLLVGARKLVPRYAITKRDPDAG